MSATTPNNNNEGGGFVAAVIGILTLATAGYLIYLGIKLFTL